MIENFSQNYKFECFTRLTNILSIELLAERNAPEVRRWMDSEFPISKNDHETFLSNLKNSSIDKYLRVDRLGKLAGVYSLRNIHNGIATGGFWVSKSVRELSLGLSVVYFSIKYVFEKFDLSRIEGYQMKENRSAMRLNKLLGFEIKGEFVRNQKDYFKLTLNKSYWHQKIAYNSRAYELVKYSERIHEN